MDGALQGPGPVTGRCWTRRGASGCGWPARIGGADGGSRVLAPLTKLKLWKARADTTPGRTEPAAKATAARIAGADLQRLEAQVGAKRDRISDELGDAEAAVRKAEARRPPPATQIRARERHPRAPGPRDVRGGRP